MDLREIAEELDYRLFGETRTNYRHDLIMFALRSVAPRWVPVGEGLPEKGRVVLVCRVSDVDCSPTKIGWLCETGEWSLFESPYGPVRVTHWMPLPPPPEGCKEAGTCELIPLSDEFKKATTVTKEQMDHFVNSLKKAQSEGASHWMPLPPPPEGCKETT